MGLVAVVLAPATSPWVLLPGAGSGSGSGAGASGELVVPAVVAVAVLVASAVLALVRLVRGPDDASRAVVGDLLFFCAIGIFVVVGAVRGTAVLFDVAVLATLSGVLATMALARLLTRGTR